MRNSKKVKLCTCNCGCGEPATCRDDDGNATCDDCQEYVVDDDGGCHCGKSAAVEEVTEGCGAGGQTRTYLRLRPPEAPEEDPEGRWACYWDGYDDGWPVSRHATYAEAVQAVSARDWPPPGDHTRYLCGYEVRRLKDGHWQCVNA